MTENPIGTEAKRKKLRRRLKCDPMLHPGLVFTALDGLDIAEEMAEALCPLEMEIDLWIGNLYRGMGHKGPGPRIERLIAVLRRWEAWERGER